MPVNTVSEAPPNIQELDGAKLTLAQVNHILEIYDRLKEEDKVDNPMAVAISQFKRSYHKEGDGWVRNKEKKSPLKVGRRVQQARIDQIKDLREQFDDIRRELTEFEGIFEDFLSWAEYADLEEDPVLISPEKIYQQIIPQKEISWLEQWKEQEEKIFVSPKLSGIPFVLSWNPIGGGGFAVRPENIEHPYPYPAPEGFDSPSFVLEGILNVKSEDICLNKAQLKQLLVKEDSIAPHFWIYDIVYYEDKSLEELPYEDRLKILRSLSLPTKIFTVLAQRPVVSKDQLEGVLEWAKGRPHSKGAYIRKASSPYAFGESDSALVIDNKIEVKAEVLEDYELGLPDNLSEEGKFVRLGGTVSEEEYKVGDIVNVEIKELRILSEDELVWEMKVLEITDGPAFTSGQAINMARDAGILKEVPLKEDLENSEDDTMVTFNGDLTDAELSDIGKAMKVAHELNSGLRDALESCGRRSVFSTIKMLSKLVELVKEKGAYGFIKVGKDFSYPEPSSLDSNKVINNLEEAIHNLDQETPDFAGAGESIKSALKNLGYVEVKTDNSLSSQLKEIADELDVESPDYEAITKKLSGLSERIGGLVEKPAPEIKLGIEDEIPEDLRKLEVKIFGETEDQARIGGYLVKWGNPEELDLVGDYFTPETDMALEFKAPLMFHHGIDEQISTTILGERVKSVKDDIGVWVEHWVAKANEYWKFVEPLLKAGRLYYSPGSAAHLVRREEDGQLKMFRVVEDSLTPTPCQYRLRPVEQMKAAFEEAGLEFDIPSDDIENDNKDELDIEEELRVIKAKFEELGG